MQEVSVSIYLIKKVMERILSDVQCSRLIAESEYKDWERVDRFGKYDQIFIEDQDISNSIQNYFDREIVEKPILKLIRFSKGDSIPTFSADYSNKEDEYFQRYRGTNFIIQIYLNTDFTGGFLTKGVEKFIPNSGFGIIQSKTEKCSISKIDSGTAYFLFVFISKIKTVSLL